MLLCNTTNKTSELLHGRPAGVVSESNRFGVDDPVFLGFRVSYQPVCPLLAGAIFKNNPASASPISSLLATNNNPECTSRSAGVHFPLSFELNLRGLVQQCLEVRLHTIEAIWYADSPRKSVWLWADSSKKPSRPSHRSKSLGSTTLGFPFCTTQKMLSQSKPTITRRYYIYLILLAA